MVKPWLCLPLCTGQFNLRQLLKPIPFLYEIRVPNHQLLSSQSD
jgi:hypothetical protein